MQGGVIVAVMILCGLAGGIAGRMKGSSFFIWAIICAIPPFFGLLAVAFYRNERDEPRVRCPGCGRTVRYHEALCTRCGTELDPGYTGQPSPAP
jgi:hypothetical protein